MNDVIHGVLLGTSSAKLEYDTTEAHTTTRKGTGTRITARRKQFATLQPPKHAVRARQRRVDAAGENALSATSPDLPAASMPTTSASQIAMIGTVNRRPRESHRTDHAPELPCGSTQDQTNAKPETPPTHNAQDYPPCGPQPQTIVWILSGSRPRRSLPQTTRTTHAPHHHPLTRPPPEMLTLPRREALNAAQDILCPHIDNSGQQSQMPRSTARVRTTRPVPTRTARVKRGHITSSEYKNATGQSITLEHNPFADKWAPSHHMQQALAREDQGDSPDQYHPMMF